VANFRVRLEKDVLYDYPVLLFDLNETWMLIWRCMRYRWPFDIKNLLHI